MPRTSITCMLTIGALALGCNIRSSKLSNTRVPVAGDGAKSHQAPTNSNHSNDEVIQETVTIRTRDGATLSAIVARKNGAEPAPAALQFTIYVRKQRDRLSILESVNHGYVGVVAYTRGKNLSPQQVWPYEHEVEDTRAVIDWLSRQPWCDGRVAMFGGSYNGFSQWAATKSKHPALKTIVPYVAQRPGMGLPMENNIFMNPNYEWAFFVGNNKTLDRERGADRQRSRELFFKWFRSGQAYRKLDELDGVRNPWFQRWIKHPAFDSYWQRMAPYKEEFAHIDIPVLTIDGYYNDSQNSSLYFLREHRAFNPNAEHYLVIGPYGHFGAQKGGETVINGYRVDEVALIDTTELTYQWFDYVLKGKAKPTILRDKVNYQVMGLNTWRSSPSLAGMSDQRRRLWFSTKKSDPFQELSKRPDDQIGFSSQTVDLGDRSIFRNDYYPAPIIKDAINPNDGLYFVSDPLEEPVLYNGSFSGKIKVAINKRDFDFGVTLYEITPNNKFFHISYFVGRASFAIDPTKRSLLQPGRIEEIPFSNTHIVSKKLEKGSRLLVSINVNLNPFSQVNYGTGKDVSTETIDDAGPPLEIQWYNDSFIEIPLKEI